MSLPDGATPLQWFEEPGASCGLADISGRCWIYGLESDGSNPTSVLKLIRRLERFAVDAGYSHVGLNGTNTKVLELAASLGYQVQAVIMEKAIHG